MNRGNNVTGYAFPNIPSNWTQEEKRFALALRGLFDTLFQKTRGLDANYDKDSYDSLKDRPKIGGVTLTGDKSLSDIGIKAATSEASGLMTPAQYTKLDGIEAEATKGPFYEAATADDDGLMTSAMFMQGTIIWKTIEAAVGASDASIRNSGAAK